MSGKSRSNRSSENRVYLAFNKPAGAECSRAPSSHRSVFDLLPEEFLRSGAQPVGRLDADATGLLLFTNDGKFNHILTSPRRKLPKTYRVGLRQVLTPEQEQRLREGVVLRDDPKPTAPALVTRLSDREAEITITEGRYHQVRRMFVAAGNHVLNLKRISIGGLQLPEDLPEGEWRILTAEELAAVLRSTS